MYHSVVYNHEQGKIITAEIRVHINALFVSRKLSTSEKLRCLELRVCF